MGPDDDVGVAADPARLAGPTDVTARFGGQVRQLLDDASIALRLGDRASAQALATAALALQPGNPEAQALLDGPAQRRQMTLLFCDVVGSTQIANDRDPEETGEIMAAYAGACDEAIRRYGGFTNERKGDGLLVRFGYPEVAEDDTRRAVLCALAIVASVRERLGRRGDLPGGLPVRVAVHTDLVVLDGSDISGAASSEVARLQSLAPPDAVVVSDATEALVRPWFDLRSLGRTTLRGISRPVEVYLVEGERRGDAGRVPSRVAPFAGRHAEVARLRSLWAPVDGPVDGPGEPRIPAVVVTGPPGVGKTRLVREAAAQAQVRLLECRCSRYHESTSLFPVRRLLEEACGIVQADDADARLDKLRAALLAVGGGGTDLPFLASALGAPTAVAPDVDAGRMRDLAVVAAAQLLLRHTSRSPSVLFVDDLQWADRSTVDLLSVLLSMPVAAPALVATSREGVQPPWPVDRVARMPLDVMPEGDLLALAARMPEGAELPPERRAELVARSDGMPLFLEELVRTAVAVGHGQEPHRSVLYSDHQIPAALRDPLLARLSQSHVDLDLAQIAATIGRDVDRQLLWQMTGVAPAALDERLASLVAAGLVDAAPDGRIRFRHELVRELAYETQRLSVRRRRHSEVADLLLARGWSGSGDQGQAAFHLEGAQRFAEAIELNVASARRDLAVGAYEEAIRRLGRSLGLARRLPAGPDRDRTELALRELRSYCAVAVRGYAAPEAAEDHPRCLEISDALELAPELLPSLMRSWAYYAFRGDLAEADDVLATMDRLIAAGRVATLAPQIGRGFTAFFRGRFAEARQILAQFEHEWERSDGASPEEWPVPNDPLATVYAHLVPTSWICGDAPAADAAARKAVRRAAGLPFPVGPFSEGYVASLRCVTARLAGDDAGAAALAADMVRLGERHGFALFTLIGGIQRDIGLVRDGGHEILARLAAGIEAWRTLLMANVWTPYLLTELAVCQVVAGQPDAALVSIDDALESAKATGSTFYLVETLRVRHEVRRMLGHGDADDDRQRALRTARSQGATALEARLTALSGQVAAVRPPMAPV